MRAWMLPAGSDGFDKLYMEDLPDPVAGPGEVLIAPKAWSINYRDFAVASGRYFGGALEQAAIPLSDGAGDVVAIGEGVTSVAVGDRVLALTGFGGFATHVLADAKQVIKIPDAMKGISRRCQRSGSHGQVAMAGCSLV